jgi:Domain of unknown function (DUF4189)
MPCNTKQPYLANSTLRFYIVTLLLMLLTNLVLPTAMMAQIDPNNPSSPTQPCQPWPHCAQGYPAGPHVDPSAPAKPAPPTHRWVSVMSAVAGHPDAVEVWAIWDTEARVERIESDVVAACHRVMGSGCSLLISGTNGSIAVLRSPNDLVSYFAWGNNPTEASKKVREYCRGLGIECVTYKIFTAKPWQKRIAGNEPDRMKTYFPNAAQAIPYVAIAAWPVEEPADQQWLGKSWISTGVKGRSNAERTVIDRCTRDSGAKCIIGSVSIGGALAMFSNNRDASTYWAAIPSANDAKGAKERCKVKMKGAQCTLMNVFDAQTRRMIVVDDAPIAR